MNRRRSLALRLPGDLGPAERRTHDATTVETLPAREGGGRRLRVRMQSPLERHRIRGEIDARQAAAGERLARDWSLAQLQPRVVQRYEAKIASAQRRSPPGSVEPPLGAAAAAERWRAAVSAVGPILRDLLVAVACEERPARDWAANGGRAPGDGIALLRAALDALADHYDPPRRARTRVWSGDAAPPTAPANDADDA